MLTRSGYNVLAALSLVGAFAITITSIAVGQQPVDTIALATPFVGLAGTIAGRGSDEPS